jgi:chromosome segregation ATPase
MTTTVELRNRIDAIESQKLILTSQRDDISFAALVDRDSKAIAEAAELNAKLAALTTEESMLNAALKTALRLEAEAKAAEATKQKQADLQEAEALLPEVEQLARQIDEAMKILQDATVAFQDKWAQLKRLSGAGPTVVATKVHIERALRTGLRGLPGLMVDLVSPTQRCSASSLNAAWSLQVRNVAAKVEPVKAEAPKTKNHKTAKAAA